MSRGVGRVFRAGMSGMAARLDPVQEALLTEPCILVNTKDEVLGQASKRECHQVESGTSLLHRAFSLFVFNSRDELLLQQRSDTKITFPGLWTNTCCSHPLATPQEMEEDDQIGARSAAQRRLELELGVPYQDAPVKEIKFLTRILYEAESNAEWGEHELDYILFLKRDQINLNPNTEEVQAVEWVGKEHLQDFLKDLESRNVGITPWFKLCTQELLPFWWKNLDRLEEISDKKIHNFYKK